MAPLNGIEFFERIIRAPRRSFFQLCLAFAQDIESYISAHRIAHTYLCSKLQQQHTRTAPHPRDENNRNPRTVSEAARSEGCLAGFCLARLVELYQGQTQEVTTLRGVLARELKDSVEGDWDDEVLLDEILSDVDSAAALEQKEVNEQVLTETRHAERKKKTEEKDKLKKEDKDGGPFISAHQRSNAAGQPVGKNPQKQQKPKGDQNGRGSSDLTSPENQTIREVVRFCFRTEDTTEGDTDWSLYGIYQSIWYYTKLIAFGFLIMIAVYILGILFEVAFESVFRPPIEAVLDVISTVAAGLRAILGPIVARVLASITTTISAGWTALTSTSPKPKPPADVGLPMMPIAEGIRQGTKSLLYMSEIAMNLSVVPLLLFHSRSGVMGAADMVRASDLENKYNLSETYNDLETNMDELIGLTKQYNTAVPDFITSFKFSLSKSFKRIDGIQAPDFEISSNPVFWIPVGCAAGALLTPDPPWMLTAACGVSLSITTSIVACLQNPEYLANSCFCQTCVTNIPGMKPYLEKLMFNRKRVVNSLGELIEDLINHVSRLLAVANRGATLSLIMENNFRKIAEMQQRNENDLEMELAFLKEMLAEAEKGGSWYWPPSWYWPWTPTSKSEAERRRRIALQLQIHNLKEIKLLFSVASHSFLSAKTVLHGWLIDLGMILESVKHYQRLAFERDWAQAWEGWADWEELRTSFEGLGPLLESLVRANERQLLKASAGEAQVSQRSQYCYTQYEDARARGEKTGNWDDCFFEGMIIA
jgi:hypothetical protein